jgi:uncharacterized membrane protein YbhN (UPF0104 family)
MRSWMRPLYPYLRWAFFLASIAFLVSFAYTTIMRSQTPLWPLVRGALAETAVSSLFFLLAALATVPAWRALLRSLGMPSIRLRAILRIFSLTQIAKYLPGNVGHHVGRVALARMHLGIPTATTTLSIVQEGALVIAAAMLVGGATVFAPHAGRSFDGELRALVAAAVVGGFGVLVLTNRYRPRLAGPGVAAWRTLLLRTAPTWHAVASALPWHVLVHLLNGIAVAVIASAMVPLDAVGLAVLSGSYALSWVIGFLLPGAPGGLGVRESAFVLLASSAWPPDVLLAMATLSRVGTIVADLLLFLGGAALSVHRQNSKQVTDRNDSE